jgi:hypothetical protein
MKTIKNTPVNSGLGDTLSAAFGICNDNFTDIGVLLSGLTANTGTTVITETSQLINDGANGTNPFITALDIAPLYALIAAQNTTISGLTSTIINQNSLITTINSDIIDIKNRLTNCGC